MLAIQTSVRLVAGGGDEIVVPTLPWLNFVGAIEVGGARTVKVPMDFVPGTDARWQVDVDRIARAVTPWTRALVVNSPSNPSDWVAGLDDLRAILDLARRVGL